MKTCTKCEIEKDDSQFRGSKTKQCIQCEIDKAMTKMLKFKNNDIGLENLDTTLENIIVKSKYLISTYTLPLESAIWLIKEGKAQVYKPDIIYRISHENESWIVRYHVNERDNYKCHYCGNKGNTVDHVIPKSKGGEFTEENLVRCCGDCNLEKGSMSYEEYKEYILLPKCQRISKTKVELIKRKQEKSKKESRISAVLLKQKDKFVW